MIKSSSDQHRAQLFAKMVLYFDILTVPQILTSVVVYKFQCGLFNQSYYGECVRHLAQILTSGVVYKFQCGLFNQSYYGGFVRHLAVRSGEHIGISP